MARRHSYRRYRGAECLGHREGDERAVVAEVTNPGGQPLPASDEPIERLLVRTEPEV
jgi:hypothetical protein